MKKDQIEEGRITRNSKGVGTVTRGMVLKRARELAVINGRSPHHVLESDFEQAKRELTGKGDADPKEAILESAPESERWDPLPGSPGHKMRTIPEPDERTDNEKLVEEGMEDAEHDQMIRATREAKRKDQSGS